MATRGPEGAERPQLERIERSARARAVSQERERRNRPRDDTGTRPGVTHSAFVSAVATLMEPAEGVTMSGRIGGLDVDGLWTCGARPTG